MKKNYITYLLLGGAVYYYIVNQKKKDKLKELEVKTLALIKKLPVIKEKTNKQQDMFFQSSILNKDLLQYVKTKPSVKKEKYNFPFLKPRSINAIPSFPDMC